MIEKPIEAFPLGWREVLDLPPTEGNSRVVEAAYRRQRSRWHPDRPDGDASRFHEVQTAYEQAQQEIGK